MTRCCNAQTIHLGSFLIHDKKILCEALFKGREIQTIKIYKKEEYYLLIDQLTQSALMRALASGNVSSSSWGCPLGRLDQKNDRQSGSSSMYGMIRVSRRTQLRAENPKGIKKNEIFKRTKNNLVFLVFTEDKPFCVALLNIIISKFKVDCHRS